MQLCFSSSAAGCKSALQICKSQLHLPPARSRRCRQKDLGVNTFANTVIFHLATTSRSSKLAIGGYYVDQDT
ncbi:hypothetical protein Cob_v008861 [Colletotrichum orbiculare MAFF 240422]|uniref:Uncharacterized protein n=1 Tax=Colletotrichum orbiculare (strain 104-T / ATCC 96160 / CBS 514.97 / LARS 414 / MAFF 240422) TaxID=1213857 RepID=A0A484FKG9_COLOR|nr:hypothetical protein Cob_v008861 [Colletotrichum orbiculare MAFF 240422]